LILLSKINISVKDLDDILEVFDDKLCIVAPYDMLGRYVQLFDDRVKMQVLNVIGNRDLSYLPCDVYNYRLYLFKCVLKSSSEDVREKVAQALKNFNDKEAYRELLNDLLVKDCNVKVKNAAKESLEFKISVDIISNRIISNDQDIEISA